MSRCFQKKLPSGAAVLVLLILSWGLMTSNTAYASRGPTGSKHESKMSMVKTSVSRFTNIGKPKRTLRGRLKRKIEILRLKTKYRQLKIKMLNRPGDFRNEVYLVDFGKSDAGVLVQKLKHRYRKKMTEFPTILLNADPNFESHATADIEDNEIVLSMKAFVDTLSGDLRALIHELRHIGNVDHRFLTLVKPLNDHSSTLTLGNGAKGLAETYGSHYFAEEINNYGRWHSQDQFKAHLFLGHLRNIRRELKVRMFETQLSDESSRTVSFYLKDGEQSFQISTFLDFYARNEYPNRKERMHHWIDLILLDLDPSLGIIDAKGTKEKWGKPNTDLKIKLFSHEPFSENHKTRQKQTMKALDETIEASENLLRRRAPRKSTEENIDENKKAIFKTLYDDVQ